MTELPYHYDYSHPALNHHLQNIMSNTNLAAIHGDHDSHAVALAGDGVPIGMEVNRDRGSHSGRRASSIISFVLQWSKIEVSMPMFERTHNLSQPN